MDLRPVSIRPETFVHEAELWLPKDAATWKRSSLDRLGIRSEDVSVRDALRSQHRFVGRVLATGRAQVDVVEENGSGHDVSLALPFFAGGRLDALLVLRCGGAMARSGCVEIWEPLGKDELAHAEGYYGSLATFEISSRLARFRRGVGLPGIAWDRRIPQLVSDVRASPTFLRTSLAREHGLALGVAIPILRDREVVQVVSLITSAATPLASAVEVWLPDASHRLWLEDAVYAPDLERLFRDAKATCFMRGEGIVGRAYDRRRPLLWSRSQRDAREIDAEALRMNLDSAIALPIVDDGVVRSVLVLRF